jgi:folate-binding protein YgfZ
MVSNDVEALPVGASCEALLLTAKARVIAPLRVWRRADDDFLLLAEPGLAEAVRAQLLRMRFRARVEVEPEEHRSFLVLGTSEGGIPNADYGEPAVEVLDEEPPGEPIAEDELEVLRILAATPRMGRELDDRVLPAEAGLVERAVSFDKGCYPGQEPIARLHYRGHANRGLRVLELSAADGLPEPDAPVRHGERDVGRVTSAVRVRDGRTLALGYVRVEVPPDAVLDVAGRPARVLPPKDAATLAAPARP